MNEEDTKRADLKKYLIALVSPFLGNPDALECSHSVDAMGTLYTLKIAKEDFGRIIGREGNTIKAIKLLLRSAGLTNGIRASIRIPEAN
jgi:predicted RNA-binding protein YlqC (UPF0109 family)